MRRSTKATSIAVAIGAGVAAVAWMLKDRLIRPAPQNSTETPAFRVAPPRVAPKEDADDLAVINGIGPVFKSRLAAAGVNRFAELARLDAERIAEIAGVSAGRAEDWIAQARSLA